MRRGGRGALGAVVGQGRVGLAPIGVAVSIPN